MPTVQRPLLALGLRLLAALALATLIMLVKVTVESGVAFAEVLFWRAFVTVPVLLAWLAWRGDLARLRTRRMPVHLRRAAIGIVGMALTFGAPLLLPLAESTALGFTTPLFAVILSALLLREPVGPVRWGAVALGFAGVVVITQPGHSPIAPLGAAVGLAAAFVVALVSIQIRDLARTDEPVSIVFWFALFASIAFALLLPWSARSHAPHQWLLLFGVGLLGCLAQLLLTASLRFGQVASVIVMDYSSLIWATGYGWLIWGEVPAIATWLGAPLIVAAGAVIAWREHRLRKPAAPVAPGSGE